MEQGRGTQVVRERSAKIPLIRLSLPRSLRSFPPKWPSETPILCSNLAQILVQPLFPFASRGADLEGVQLTVAPLIRSRLPIPAQNPRRSSDAQLELLPQSRTPAWGRCRAGRIQFP